MVKLANIVAARVGRLVMAHVFSRRPSNRCPKTMNSMILAAVEILSGVWVMPGACQSRLGGCGWVGSELERRRLMSVSDSLLLGCLLASGIVH